MTIVLARPGPRWLVAVGLVVLAALVLLALGPGLLRAWATGVADPVQELTLARVRAPRVLLGALCGAALGLAGALLQDGLRNPLAGPELLGVSSGAALVAATSTVLALPVPLGLRAPLALLGAAAAGLVVLLAASTSQDATRVVLVGAAVSAVLSGLVVAVVSLGTAGDVDLLLRYLLGSLAGRGWDDVLVLAPLLLPATLGAWLLRRPLGVLALGDPAAAALGVRPARLRLAVVTVALALTAAVVAVCGPVAFVALLSPHLVRGLGGTSVSARVLPAAGLAGAVLLVGADLLARTVLAPVELPVGIATTVLGVPLLLVALRRQGW